MNRVTPLSLSVILFLFSFSGIVPNVSSQPLEIGITGGLNMSSHLNNFRFAEEDINLDLEPKITQGYQGGVIARKAVSQSLYLQLEPSLTLLGARYQESFSLRGLEFQTDSRTELLYLQVPLLLQISTTGTEKQVYGDPYPETTYHISGGIFGSYLLDAHFSGTNTGNTIGVPFESEFSNNIVSQYSDYDSGVILGVGLEHGHKRKVGFETRVQYSVYESGNTQQLIFKPQNMAITFSFYFLL